MASTTIASRSPSAEQKTAAASRRRSRMPPRLARRREATELLAGVAEDRRPVCQEQVVELDLPAEPREALPEPLLLRLGIVAEQVIGEESEAVVVDDAIGDGDRPVTRHLERS